MRRSRTIPALLLACGVLALALWWWRERAAPGAPAPHAAAPTAERASAAAPARAGADEGRSGLPSVPPIEERDAPESSELRGRVVDELGAPVPAASVTLRTHALRGLDARDPALDRTGELLAQSTTDAAGEFRFALSAERRVDVSAELTGWCAARAYDCAPGVPVELVLRRGASVSGRIARARDGAPVAEARVRVQGPGGRDAVETQSGADGSYALVAGTTVDRWLEVTPRVECSAFLIPLTFADDGTCRQDVLVEDGLLVEGRVSAAETGLPIAGALVIEGEDRRRTVTSDAQGEYRLTGFGNPDVAVLYAEAPGYGRALGALGPAVEGRMRVDFELARAHRARGRVVDGGGRPLAAAYVAAVSSEDLRLDWRSTRTAGDGAFLLADLAPALRHTLVLAHPEHATQIYDFPAAESMTEELDLGTFVLRPPASLGGRILDEQGAPLPGARLNLAGWNTDRGALLEERDAEPLPGHAVQNRSCFSDGDGRFWFGNLPGADYVLQANAPGRTLPPATPVHLEEGEARDLELRLEALPGIRGIVVDELGKVLAGIHVSAWGVDLRDPALDLAEVSASTRTAADGTFALNGLPEGEYRLELFPTVYLPEDMRAPLLFQEVHGVATSTAPQRVQMKRGLTIEGLVQDANGAPLYGYVVLARGPESELGWRAFTDTEGRFAMPLPHGSVWTLELFASQDAEEGASLAVRPDVPAGTLDVLLRLAE